MAPASGGSRQSTKDPSLVCTNPLETEETKQAISCLLQTVQACIGPRSKQHVIHNNSGGHVTVTSSSSRLLSTISVSNPVLQLLMSPILNHNKKHVDGGLFSLLMSLFLTETSAKLDISKHLLVEVYEVLLEWSIELLDSKDFLSRSQLNLDSVEQLVTVTRSVIKTKSGCCLSYRSLDSVSRLMVESFLRAVSPECGLCNDLLYVGIEGKDPEESKLLPGLLMEAPHICPLRHKVLQVKKSVKELDCKMITVALFTVSLAGDASPLPNVTFQVSQTGQVESVVREMLLELGQKVVDAEVGLVVCQKVVHPSLKRLWKKAGIIVLDRLGTHLASAVHKLSGATPITSTMAKNLHSSCFGWISDVQHLVIEGKSYVQLTSSNSSVQTLMLCNFAEEPLAELMSVCKSSVSVLEQVLRQPIALTGGGVWQVELALMLYKQVQMKATSSSDELGCTDQQFKDAAMNILGCLVKVASAVDKGSGYLHKGLKTIDKLRDFENLFPCEFTQSLPNHDDMFSEAKYDKAGARDSFPVLKDALMTAVSSAVMALSVGVIIKDVN